MKQIIATILISISLISCQCAEQRVKKVDKLKAQMGRVAKEYKNETGVEAITLGPFMLSLMKTYLKFESRRGEDMSALLAATKGVKKVIIIEYQEAEPSVKAALQTKLEEILSPTELLLEMNTEESSLHVYAVFSKDTETISSCVIDSEESIICLFGKISTRKIAAAIKESI